MAKMQGVVFFILSPPLTKTAYEGKMSPFLIQCQGLTLYQRSLWFPHLFLSNHAATLQNMSSSAWAALWMWYTARCDPLAVKCIESSILMVDEKQCWASTAERLSSQYSWYEEKPIVTWTRSLKGKGDLKREGDRRIVKTTKRDGSVSPIVSVSSQECHSWAQCFMGRVVLSEGRW